MRLKKLLIVITVIVATMLSLMLATSYAWYSFENGSTTFDAVTNNDDITVSYQKGEYINTDIAVPITLELVDKYSSKNNFNVKVNGDVKYDDVMVSVSLTNVSIDDALKNDSFIIDLFYQGSKVKSVNGSSITSGTDIFLDKVTLNNDLDNLFEVRVYILSNDSFQNDMMNKTFSAKVKVDVISRLKTNFKDYTDNPDINISSITIDGEVSKSLPTSGYYDMTATCQKGSVLTWDSTWKTITYKSGSKINDNCSLVFTTDNDPEYVYLNEMPVGSYVKYVGNNGCPEGHCDGTNANYVDDDNMGYCDYSDYKFIYNGWRIGYIEEGSVHLISAGAPECLCTNSDGTTFNNSCSSHERTEGLPLHLKNLNNMALKYCNSKYANGGVCDSTTSWAMNGDDFVKIVGNNLNSCLSDDSKFCGLLNEFVDIGTSFWFATFYDSALYDDVFYWDPSARAVLNNFSDRAYGVRPVLSLESSVKVTGGSGVYEDPYLIEN